MDLNAAEKKHNVKNNLTDKKGWLCPCNGCTKSVKQERNRILKEIDQIDTNSSSQINALGIKILIKEIINEK